MHDDFANSSVGLTSPAVAGEAIVPSDSSDLIHATRALYVGQSGDIVAQLVSGDVVTFVNMQSGVIFPLRLSRILATGTTATDLVGLR